MITFIANVLLVVVTAIYVWLTHKILRSQTDPLMIVYASRDIHNTDIVTIVLENVGKGVARDIRLEPTCSDDDTDKWDDFLNGQSCNSGFASIIKGGFPALVPGKKIAIRWRRIEDVGLNLMGGFTVVCRCKRLALCCKWPRWLATSPELRTDCLLDFKGLVNYEVV